MPHAEIVIGPFLVAVTLNQTPLEEAMGLANPHEELGIISLVASAFDPLTIPSQGIVCAEAQLSFVGTEGVVIQTLKLEKVLFGFVEKILR